MRRLSPFASLLLLSVVLPSASRAAGPTVAFTLPAENTTPATFGALPFPNDLYFDQGRPGDGDGTLLNAGASIGLGVQVIQQNTDVAEDSLDLIEGFGTTSAIYFFLSGPLDPASLPASSVVSPSLTDSVFCADAATATPVPIAIRFDVDSRIDNVLGVIPLPGRPLAPKTTYTCVVRTSVTGGGMAVEASADWLAVRDGASANSDADAIYDPVVTTLGGHGVPAAAIAGMTVFTTQATADDLISIQADVLPTLPVPTADFTSRPELVFSGATALTSLLGASPHSHVATIATGFYPSPQFQTIDPDGTAPLADLPAPPSFVNCIITCETNDERFTHDINGRPAVLGTLQVPVTVVIPSGTPPPGGWPVIIQQHGLGGQRDTVVAFGEADAAAGFASIGIDAVAHGYRFFDCTPSAPCSQDHSNNVGGTAVPDGFVDGTLAGQSVGFLTVNLGFFQAFHNFLGIRDNFRQTYADLLQLVRLVQGHSIDSALGTQLDDSRIFYMGHSLGGLMGSGFVPIEPDLKASLLNATGGGLTNQLFINSSIGAGAQALVNGILGLDPANIADQFAIPSNLIQTVLDPGDGLNSASLLLNPAAGGPRNVIQVEDYGDQVVPNQANEAIALAAGLPLFDPFVQNLHQSALSLPVVATPGTVSANAAGGLATAAVVQNGPATHAASLGATPGTMTFIPEFAHWEEFPATGVSFPNLERGVRVPNADMLDEVLAWFRDVADNGPPGTFSFGGQPNFNPAENTDVPAGASTHTFFTRTVNVGGATPFSEPTPDVALAFTANAVATRVTAARSILGSGTLANDRDVPPGAGSTVGTPGILPFFVTLQRELPGLFATNVALYYTTTELGIAGIPTGSADEQALVIGTFTPGTCTVGGAQCTENSDCGANGPCLGGGYTLLPTTVDTSNHIATATGLTSFSTFAVLHPDGSAYRPPLVAGGGSKKKDCLAEWAVMNPTNAPFVDKKGRINRTQTCTDGDVTCDADRTADGFCGFRVGVCFDQTDALLPLCSVTSPPQSLKVSRPKNTSPKPEVAAAAQALLNALTAFPNTTLSGRHLNVVNFDASQMGGSPCSDLATLRVPADGKKFSVTGTTKAVDRTRDGDRLKLVCLPAS